MSALSLTNTIKKALSRTVIQSLCVVTLTGATGVLLATYPDTASARGGVGARVGSGNFTRSSPASGGNFSSRPAGSYQSASGVPSSGGVRSVGGAGSVGGASSVGGAGSAGGFGQPGDRGGVSHYSGGGNVGDGKVNPLGSGREVSRPIGTGDLPPRATTLPAVSTPAEMQNFRQQFQQQNKDNPNWDDHIYNNVDRPVAAAVVAGTAIDNRNEVINAIADPTVLTEMPCTIEAVVADSDVTYYRCASSWYKRGYQSGEVVYIPSDAPKGY